MKDRLVENAALGHLAEGYICIWRRIRHFLASVQVLLLFLDSLIVVEVALHLRLRDSYGLGPELYRSEALEITAKYPQDTTVVLGLAVEVEADPEVLCVLDPAPSKDFALHLRHDAEEAVNDSFLLSVHLEHFFLRRVLEIETSGMSYDV